MGEWSSDEQGGATRSEGPDLTSKYSSSLFSQSFQTLIVEAAGLKGRECNSRCKGVYRNTLDWLFLLRLINQLGFLKKWPRKMTASLYHILIL